MKPYVATCLAIVAVVAVLSVYAGSIRSQSQSGHRSGSVVLIEEKDSGGYPVDCFVIYGSNGYGVNPSGISCLYGQGPKE